MGSTSVYQISTATADAGNADAIIPRSPQAKRLIRRFTDQLSGENELEISAKETQAEIDVEEETEREIYLKQLWSDEDENSTFEFYPAEIAKDELEKTMKKLRDSTQIKHPWPKKIFRGTANKQAIDMLQGSLSGNISTDFKMFESHIEDLKGKWDKSHGKVLRSFDRLCRTLKSHSNVLKIFPTTNSYVSIFCSSISCLAQAAQNNSELSEMLLDSIAEISEQVSQCSDAVWIFPTRNIKRILASIYAKMFEFFHSAMKWFLIPRVGRFFNSFNEDTKKNFEDTTTSIKNKIDKLYRQTQLALQAKIAQDEIRHQRQMAAKKPSRSNRDLIPFLEATLERLFSEKFPSAPYNKPQIGPSIDAIEAVTNSSGGIKRSQLRKHEGDFRQFIIGEEGQELLDSPVFWRSEDLVLFRWRDWMKNDAKSSTLWVSSKHEYEGVSSAKALALSTVVASWEAEMPVISHFCRPAREHELHDGMSKAETGLMGLVYNFICQIMQFNGDDEVLDMHEDILRGLNGRSDSWTASLDILRALLDRIPPRFICVIHGLNELEWGEKESYLCRQVVDILLACQKKSGVVFSLLLTTDGQSRLLSPLVNIRDRCLSEKKAIEVVRGKGFRQL